MTVSHALFIYFERAIMIFVNNFGKFEKKNLEKKPYLNQIGNWRGPQLELKRALIKIWPN